MSEFTNKLLEFKKDCYNLITPKEKEIWICCTVLCYRSERNEILVVAVIMSLMLGVYKILPKQ